MADTPPTAPPTPGFVPSASTTGSAIGAALATIIVYGFHTKGIDFPAGMEAAIGAIITVLAGYLPAAGRR
jgi:hypothetical protein